jgi:hypothetical protein
MVTADLSLEQLINALRRLPAGEKVTLWRMLDSEIDRAAIGNRFSDALQAIRTEAKILLKMKLWRMCSRQ